MEIGPLARIASDADHLRGELNTAEEEIRELERELVGLPIAKVSAGREVVPPSVQVFAPRVQDSLNESREYVDAIREMIRRIRAALT